MAITSRFDDVEIPNLTLPAFDTPEATHIRCRVRR